MIEDIARAVVAPQRCPAPEADEVIVRTQFSLVSPGTELAMYQGTHSALLDPSVPFAKYPFYPGYSAIGEIIAVGSKIPTKEIGRKIFYFGQHASFHTLRLDKAFTIECPLDLEIEKVLLSRLVQISATATYAWRKPPERVLVLGAGFVGLFAAQACAARGIPNVIVHDINRERLAAAARCGLNITSNDFSWANPAVSHFDNLPPDCVIEATGAPQLIPHALRTVARGGDVILLGSPRGEVEIDVYRDVHQKGVAIIGAHETTLPDVATSMKPSRGEMIKTALDWMRRGLVLFEGVNSLRIAPEDLPAEYAKLATGQKPILAVVVDWSSGKRSSL